MLILLAAFNNLLAGVFMALMDAYGLSLVSVETWGFLWGFISLAFIGGGIVVARRGLGPNPLRVILIGNLVNWAVCATFALQSSIVMLTIGMLVWLALIPVIEAGEQTVLQRSIPYERQGRVFGFAQLVENAASPLTAFLMAPIAEVVFMPLMTDGAGADWIGDWFGTGPERGLALMFTIAGVIGVIVTAIAWASRSYRRLSASWNTATRVMPRISSRQSSTSATVRLTNAAVVATARTRFQRTHRASSKRRRTAARSLIASGSPASLMASLSGTLTADGDDDHDEVENERGDDPADDRPPVVAEMQSRGDTGEHQRADEDRDEPHVDDRPVDRLERADERAVIGPSRDRA